MDTVAWERQHDQMLRKSLRHVRATDKLFLGHPILNMDCLCLIVESLIGSEDNLWMHWAQLHAICGKLCITYVLEYATTTFRGDAMYVDRQESSIVIIMSLLLQRLKHEKAGVETIRQEFVIRPSRTNHRCLMKQVKVMGNALTILVDYIRQVAPGLIDRLSAEPFS